MSLMMEILPFVFALPASPTALNARDPAVLAAIERFVAADERTVRSVPGLAQIRHRTAGLDARFASDGTELVPRAESAKPIRMKTVALARGGVRELLEPGAMHITGDHSLELRMNGITEWWRSREDGIEQGFTLERRMTGTGTLSVEIALEGAQRPCVSDDGRTLDLVSENRVDLRFAGLHAFDRDGDPLATRFVLGVASVSIEVVDTGADYPITIDPLATSPAFAVEGNTPNAQFGVSIASAGDVNGDGFSDLIVGASNFDTGLAFEGKAYVFHGSSNGLSTTAAWTATGGQANAYFGRVVSSAGDVNDDGYSDVIVSAQLYDDDQANEGRVFLYHGSGTGLALTAAISVDGDQADGNWGQALASAGDVNGDGYSDVIMASPTYDGPAGGDSGRMGVFLGGASGISTPVAVTIAGDQSNGRFGAAVAGIGDVDGDGYADIAIGASLYDDTKTDEGKVFVYAGSGIGTSSSTSFTAIGNQIGAQFGNALNPAGDVNGDGYSDLVVGAPLFDSGEPDEGRASLYLGSATGLASSASWTVEANQTNARLGNAVTTAGDVDGDGYADVAIASLLFDGSVTDAGRVTVYLGASTGLGTTAAQTLSGTLSSEAFGQSLAFAGDVNGDGLSDLAIGAQAYSNPDSSEGRVAVYHGTRSALSTTFQWAIKGQQASARLGSSADFAGDVNGDGYSDVVFGIPSYDSVQLEEGRATLHYGASSGLTASFGWSSLGGQNGARHGSAVAGVGDIDGDGYDDVMVGAIGFDESQPDLGVARLYLGGSSGLSSEASREIVGTETGALFAGAISPAGDVDGDGFVDVLIGARGSNAGFTDAGSVYLFRGSASGLAEASFWSSSGIAASDALGTAICAAGDVDQDGFADIVLAAPGATSSTGRVDFYRGGATGPAGTADVSVSGTATGQNFGRAVSDAGDVNGDGYADVIVGLLNGARIFHGSGAGFSGSAATSLVGESSIGGFGAAVGGGGDIDGDGYSDVIVGAPTQLDGQVAEGVAYVFLGSGSGVVTPFHSKSQIDQDNANYGATVSGGGDVDGDGLADILVCAPTAENGFTDEGRGFLYYGSGDGGAARGVRVRVLRSDSVAPIAHLGRSFASTVSFDALGRSPFGRGDVSLFAEVKQLGTAFDGATVSSSAVDSGTSGATLSVESASLLDGLQKARSRIGLDKATIPFQPFLPWQSSSANGRQQADFRVGAATAVLVVSPTSEITVENFVGAADPSSIDVTVGNLGSGSLGFTIAESPAVSWLSATPTSGSGLVAGGVSGTVSLGFSTAGLTPGTYTTTLTVTNATDNADQVDIPVTLVISNPVFIPGDRLNVTFDSPSEVIDADFDGLDGEILKLTFDVATAASTIGIRVLDDQGATVVNTTAKLSTSKKVKKNIELDRAGTFTLRFTGPVAPINVGIVTSATFPANATSVKSNPKVKAGKTKNVKFQAADGAVLLFTLTGDTAGDLTLQATTPEGNILDFTSLAQLQGNGTLKVDSYLLSETGTYTLKVTNDESKTVNLKITIAPDQPIGSATLTLP